jgi:hypothetical protein
VAARDRHEVLLHAAGVDHTHASLLVAARSFAQGAGIGPEDGLHVGLRPGTAAEAVLAVVVPALTGAAAWTSAASTARAGPDPMAATGGPTWVVSGRPGAPAPRARRRWRRPLPPAPRHLVVVGDAAGPHTGERRDGVDTAGPSTPRSPPTPRSPSTSGSPPTPRSPSTPPAASSPASDLRARSGVRSRGSASPSRTARSSSAPAACRRARRGSGPTAGWPPAGAGGWRGEPWCSNRQRPPSPPPARHEGVAGGGGAPREADGRAHRDVHRVGRGRCRVPLPVGHPGGGARRRALRRGPARLLGHDGPGRRPEPPRGALRVGLFLLTGSAPPAVRRALLTCLGIQTVVAFATAAVRPFTPLAFGVLVPTLGLGACGLWAARHGTFPDRAGRGGAGRPGAGPAGGRPAGVTPPPGP